MLVQLKLDSSILDFQFSKGYMQGFYFKGLIYKTDRYCAISTSQICIIRQE